MIAVCVSKIPSRGLEPLTLRFHCCVFADYLKAECSAKLS